METKMRSLELELGAVKLVNREKYKTLNCKVEQMKKRQSDILHYGCMSRKTSINRTAGGQRKQIKDRK